MQSSSKVQVLRKSLRWIVIGALALAGVGGMVLLAMGLERDREHIESELDSLGSPATPTPAPEAGLGPSFLFVN